MTTAATNMHTISLYVRNKPGVLVRVASFLASRLQYRIAGRVSGRADEFNRMTIAVG